MGVQFSVKKFYDSLKGRFIREIKANDIVHISAPYDQYSAGTIAFHACSSTEEIYITGIGYSFSAAGMLYVTVDTSTICPVRANAAGYVNLTAKRESPFFKADASSTISICTDTAGSWAAWLCGVREPTFDKVEIV